MTIRCVKCHRKLTRPGREGMGPTCAKNALGPLPREQRRIESQPVRRDDRTVDMFGVSA